RTNHPTHLDRHIHERTHIRTHTNTYTHKHTRIHTHTNTHVYRHNTHTYTHICVEQNHPPPPQSSLMLTPILSSHTQKIQQINCSQKVLYSNKSYLIFLFKQM